MLEINSICIKIIHEYQEMANTMVQGVPQQFMYDPSVNSAQLQFNYPPKVSIEFFT